MKIGIDCRMWSTPTGRYVREIVGQIAKLDRKNEYVLFFSDKDIDGVSFPANFKKVRANVLWHTFSEQLVLPLIFLKENLDLLHVPHFNIPILYPKKFVVTIHDLTILRVNTGRASTHAYWFYQVKRLGFKVVLLTAVLRSKKILTVTDFVKRDIVKTFKVREEKVVVAPNAVTPDFKRVAESKITAILPKYRVKKPYLFYVGNAHPHKNVEGLLTAFEVVSEKHPDLQLVLGGKRCFFYERLEEEWKNAKIFPKINFAGFIDEQDLPTLYSGAEMFINPSKHEGFGLQLLEAFACGTKVACSKETSLPEVGGKAAYYFDPYDPRDMAEVILRAIDDKSNKRIKLGYKRVREYSWEKSAKKVLGLYKTV